MVLFIAAIIILLIKSSLANCFTKGGSKRECLELSKTELTFDFRMHSLGIEGYCSKFINIYTLTHRTILTPLVGFFIISGALSVKNLDNGNLRGVLIAFELISSIVYLFNSFVCYGLF